MGTNVNNGCGTRVSPSAPTSSSGGKSWIDYVGGIPGDSTFLENGDEIIPYNEGKYFRLITSADVDSFYRTREGDVLSGFIIVRGGDNGL